MLTHYIAYLIIQANITYLITHKPESYDIFNYASPWKVYTYVGT